MAIRLQCTACGKTLQVADSAAGKKARCPSCQAINDVPAATGKAPVTPTPQAASTPKPAASKPASPPTTPTSTPAKSSAGATPASNPETILVACSSCGKACRVLKASAGKTVQCPHCKGKIVVPGGKPVAKTPPTAKPIAPPPSSGGSVDIFGGVPSSQPSNSSNDIFGNLPASQPSYDMYGGGSQQSNNSLWNDIGDQAGGGGGGWQSMGPASSNAYAAPSYGGGGYGGGGGGSYSSNERSIAVYIIPGVFIALWGFFIVISGCVRIGVIAIALANAPPNAVIRWEYIIAYLAGALVGLCLGGLQLFGGIALAMRNNLGMARTGAIICTIPCFGIFCFPFGIWATILLFTGSYRRDFGE